VHGIKGRCNLSSVREAPVEAPELSISPASIRADSSSYELSSCNCKNFAVSKPPLAFKQDNNEASSMWHSSSTSYRHSNTLLMLILPAGLMQCRRENPSSEDSIAIASLLLLDEYKGN
jgi:hypothetical protein